MSLFFAMKESCFKCGFYFIIQNSISIIFQTLLTVLIFSVLTKSVKMNSFGAKMIVDIIALGLVMQIFIWAWATAEVLIYYGGFSNLTFKSVKKDIDQELGGLTYIAPMLSIIIPLTYGLLYRRK